MPEALYDRVEQIIGARPKLVQLAREGSISDIYRADFANRESLAVKLAHVDRDVLEVEGFMLRFLKKHSRLPVPEVWHSEPTLLLMTWMEGESQLPDTAQEHAAELLANLHQIHAERYGFERDTQLLGWLQPNPWTPSWLAFFRDQRLLLAAKEAVRARALPMSIMLRLEKFCRRLDDWLYEPERPALLHGNLWNKTSLLAAGGRITAFLDPAIYYGHPEVDLAAGALFGVYNARFYRRYREIRPLTPGFMELRRDLYNLYPLLVQARFHGAQYVNAVDRILRGIGF